MTAAIASPLYVDTPPHKEVVLKKVKGQLLRREESYTEALVDAEEPPVEAPDEEGKEEEEAMVMMMMNPSYNRHHHHHHRREEEEEEEEEEDNHINSPVVVEGEPGEDCFMGPALKRNIRAWYGICINPKLPQSISSSLCSIGTERVRRRRRRRSRRRSVLLEFIWPCFRLPE
jgi:hypothetical protein